MKKCNALDVIALILVIIGAINWGLIGLFHWNLISTIFGAMSAISRILYIVVGIAGLWTLYILFTKCCGKSCGTSGGSM